MTAYPNEETVTEGFLEAFDSGLGSQIMQYGAGSQTQCFVGRQTLLLERAVASLTTHLRLLPQASLTGDSDRLRIRKFK
ncbi:hypothetical protein CCHL11_02413 [Colletotrichum chlorophyti]|uniref:Uncharacterized protein n=1 Tax=Colletotrichum chlorophyti TaxID=708187 RepID=A0A1Q8S631_9PEZI|nr:hypothetical protein CCHL11_02413 [Colletotrichum chlorophyti]